MLRGELEKKNETIQQLSSTVAELTTRVEDMEKLSSAGSRQVGKCRHHIHTYIYMTNQSMRCSERQKTRQQKDKVYNTTCLKQSFFKEKLAVSGGIQTHDTRILTVPTELLRQLSWLGCITHNSRDRATKPLRPCTIVYCDFLTHHRVLGEAADRAQY